MTVEKENALVIDEELSWLEKIVKLRIDAFLNQKKEKTKEPKPPSLENKKSSYDRKASKCWN